MAGGTGRKETKKSSFYVWFLGSLESGGLRGEESVALAVRALVDKEKEEEPLKVTLQVSHKGIKIVQNFPKKVKHFIPVHAVTDVIQERKPDEDLVSCVLLLYNPATRCPVHVHTYRCDSGETAAYLRQEIASLVHRPEQQRRLVELEARLRNKGVLPPRKMLHSDGRSSSTSSGSSNPDSATLNRDRIASLYDSLAAELREKLNSVAPLLLPPRDYDTVHRSYGRLENIEERRSKTSQVVGTNGAYVPGKGSNSDGKSSGIGSEEPSDHQRPGFPSCSSGE
ncbi:unnamed protein product [Darwinula stevensoni]|uniref:PID domain-containing protein n=1 Tax=Darwinula stevensoni TaxID=69355 RepID=A0A7R9FRS6_9CRUS|nr:unnamed protein product [Darwinula stevensoni]CAG0902030.1 unnamed protein product [Darwinula stevensoni]